MRFLKPFRLVLFVLLSAATVVGGAKLYDQFRDHPSVILIVVDGLRPGALGRSAGSAQTPNIDQLIADGVTFPTAFANSPSSFPSLVSLLSGREPGAAGLPNSPGEVPPGLPLLAEAFRDQDYQTRAIVSLPLASPGRPGAGLDRGFDAYEVDASPVPTAGSVTARFRAALAGLDPERPAFLLAHYADPTAPLRAYDSARNEVQVYIDGQGPTWIDVAAAEPWEHELELRRGRHTIEVRGHGPFLLRDAHCTAGGRTIAHEVIEGDDGPTQRVLIEFRIHDVTPSAGRLRLLLEDAPSISDLRVRHRLEVEAVDRALGELFADLRSRGLWDKSLIVLTGGHGEALGEHEHVGHDANLYDELLRVPLIVKPPSGHESRAALARDPSTLARHIDIAPTILEITKLLPLPGATGVSLSAPIQRILRAEAHEPNAPERWFALRDDRYKLLYRPDSRSFELYDLSQDPSELDNVFTTQASARSDWQPQLKAMARGAPALQVDG